MAKGDLYRAVQRTGGLAPMVKFLEELQNKANKKQELTQLNDLFGQTLSNVKDVKQGTYGMTEMEDPVTGISDLVLGDYQSPDQRHETTSNMALEFLASVLQQESPDLQRAGSMFDVLSNFNPKPESPQYFQPDPYADILNKKTLEVAKPGKDKPKQPKDPFTMGGHAFGRDEQGNVDFSKLLFKTPEKPKSGKDDDIDVKGAAASFSKVLEGVKKLKDLKKTKWSEYDPKDPKFAGIPKVKKLGSEIIGGVDKYREEGKTDDEIKKIYGLPKNADLDNIDKDLEYDVPTTGGAYFVGNEAFPTQEAFNKYKENLKNNYISNVNLMIQQRGLQDAVEELRGGLKQGLPIEKAIKIFKDENPNFTKDDADALKAYFELLTM